MGMRRYIVFFAMLLPSVLWAQEGVVTLRGRVTSAGRGVPYATLQVLGTSVGVSCNDDGEYWLKVPAGSEADTVAVRSVGYVPRRLTVGELLRHGHVRLEAQEVQLQEVQVRSYRKARYLLRAAVGKIADNYHCRTAFGTFFYRDWRALDGELYLFDEAVMGVTRRGYTWFGGKRSYLFDPTVREMATDYKSLLRHRLLVYDRRQLEHALDDPDGIDQRMGFDDNEVFFDPLTAPQACYAFSDRVLAWHEFEPVQEFVADGTVYYLVRSAGPASVPNAKVHYEYVIRRSDLAIVSITAVQRRVAMPAPQDAWVNVRYNRLVIDCDSSSWTYDLRCGRHTLTHYYNNRSLHLENRSRTNEQHWQQCIDWTLTDFDTAAGALPADTLVVRPQTLMGAFGESDYNADFWGRYNTVLIDTLPLRLLNEKLLLKKKP